MGTEPRAFLAALPPPAVAQALGSMIRVAGLDQIPSHTMVPIANLHQSLSGRHFSPSRGLLDRLCRAGARISGATFSLRLEQITSIATDFIHWRFEPRRRPPEFDALLAAVQAGLATEQLADGMRHRPHVTFSYDAPKPVGPIRFDAIEFPVDEIQLVMGERTGDRYRYRIIERWHLRPSGETPVTQHRLF